MITEEWEAHAEVRMEKSEARNEDEGKAVVEKSTSQVEPRTEVSKEAPKEETTKKKYKVSRNVSSRAVFRIQCLTCIRSYQRLASPSFACWWL